MIASIQEDLASYDANNQIDPGRWYPWIRKVIDDLGVACFEYKHALVYIKDYKGKVECDFQVLESAFWVKEECHGGQVPGRGPIHYQGKSIIWDDTTTSCATRVPSCEGCDFGTCSIDTANEVTVREYVQGLPYTYYMPITWPLAVNRRVAKSWCLPHSICFGSHSLQEISIEKGEIFTNFCDGLILLNYYAYPMDENGLPMIPRNPKVELAIEQYIKWKIFETMWTNNDDAGIERKMQYWQNEFKTASFPDAEYLVKLTSFNDMTDIVRNARTRFNVFQLTQK
jgi:hypothetical protein